MIGVLGVNHTTASVEIRERYSISGDEIAEFGEILLQKTEITETVILSTCNRTEIYFYQKEPHLKKTEKQLIELLHTFKKVKDINHDCFYLLSNYDAVSHLFSVTSGVDSMVIGEDQIVNQVKEAYLRCTNLALADAVLIRLFQKSFETSKKVRTETNIQAGASSVSFLAVGSCAKLFGDNLNNKKVFIIGTGKTSRLVLEKMNKCGVTNYLFTNRTFKTAQEFAQTYNGESIEFSNFKDRLNDYDIIITATSAGRILIDKTDVKDNSKQVFIDLAVPRNIDNNVTEHKNVELISIDSLQEDLSRNTSKRIESRKEAEVIIDSMAEEFFNWMENRALRPIIKSITDNMQKMHHNEIEAYRRCYSEDVFKAVDEYADRLTKKYIRTLIKKLKEINENGNAVHSLEVINELFEFESKITSYDKN